MQIDIQNLIAHPNHHRMLAHPFSAPSALALHLDIAGSNESNLLKKESHHGVYFFRDFSVPLPRPATILAWNALVRIGAEHSTQFMVPFLPSLNHEDEVGQAIASLGSKLPSLSRKSGLHIRDEENRIIWGAVWMGDTRKGLTAQAMASTMSESIIVEEQFFDRSTAYLPIRFRMEALAQRGLIASNDAIHDLGLPLIRRLLIQFVSYKAAELWAQAYANCLNAFFDEPADSIPSMKADYYNMVNVLLDATKNKPIEEAIQEAKEPKTRRFNNIDDIFAELTR